MRPMFVVTAEDIIIGILIVLGIGVWVWIKASEWWGPRL